MEILHSVTVVVGTNGNIHFGTANNRRIWKEHFRVPRHPNFTIAGVFADLDLRLIAGSNYNRKLELLYRWGNVQTGGMLVNYDSVGFYNSGSASDILYKLSDNNCTKAQLTLLKYTRLPLTNSDVHQSFKGLKTEPELRATTVTVEEMELPRGYGRSRCL
jgi:hypothetical protein